jgi:restriction system protein
MGFFSSLAAAALDPSEENMNRFKGAKGEAQAASGLLLFLPSEYRVINDVLLPTRTGTAQIDHVVVSNYGIFVIESKNISGAIHGSADDISWTVCRGSSKFTIYNPLRQNAAHIMALAAALRMSEHLFHSLVFFWSGDCRFATPMPENVRQMGLCDYIKGKRRYLLPNADVQMAIQAIESVRLPTTKKNMDAHVANLTQGRPKGSG